MALLHMLLKAGHGNRLLVCHYNHKWGKWGDKAEAFVRAHCAKHKLALVVGQGRGRSKTNAEEKARNERLAFFARAMAEGKLEGVITAHSASDQVEGFLLRLMRGSGLKGLSGMLPASTHTIEVAGSGKVPLRLWRPLLGHRRAELRAYLKKARQPWLDDPSNTADDTARARVRKLWAAMEKAGFGEDAILASQSNLAGADSVLEKAAMEAWHACVTGGVDSHAFSRVAFFALPREIQQRLVARMIVSLTGAQMAPRLSKRLGLLDKMATGAKGKATLGGVLWAWNGQTVVAEAERR